MHNQKERITAIVLAGGTGKRMNSSTKKQYLKIKGVPILAYTLKVFQDSDIDNIILVVSEDDKEYCIENVIKKYNITKVEEIVTGGTERYHSVYNALQAISDKGYVLIHDAARPFVNNEIILECIETVKKHKACVVAVPVKDTIKIVDKNNIIVETLNRRLLWSIQTPQAFEKDLIKKSYEQIINNVDIIMTDDAMIVEKTTEMDIKIIQGSYNNIKITTPEDIYIGETIINKLNIKI